nr:retrovirus-related Pol polyprotein from transposon TNT 1-94 [Tanacetum cinerariifolium]
MEVKHDLSNELCALTPEEVAYMKKVPYALAVGSIMYAVRCTRPDVAFAQNLVSRYQQNSGKLYWVAVKHILNLRKCVGIVIPNVVDLRVRYTRIGFGMRLSDRAL